MGLHTAQESVIIFLNVKNNLEIKSNFFNLIKGIYNKTKTVCVSNGFSSSFYCKYLENDLDVTVIFTILQLSIPYIL